MKLRKAFGLNEYGIADLPKKISGVRISRILKGDDMGCSYCFPHGPETCNNKRQKDLKCWKRYRQTQWRKP